MRRFGECVSIFAAVVLCAACAVSDLSAPQEDDRLHVVMVLDPDSASQLLVVRNVGSGPLAGLEAELRGDGVAVGGAEVEVRECVTRYGPIAAVEDLACVRFEIEVVPGLGYGLSVRADSRRDLAAVTTVPGALEVVEVRTAGDSVRAVVRAAFGAASYVGIVHHSDGSPCRTSFRCAYSVVAASVDTLISVPVEGASGWQLTDWWWEAFALDANLSTHLASGNGGGLFAVAPETSVTNGLGVLGSWTRAAGGPMP